MIHIYDHYRNTGFGKELRKELEGEGIRVRTHRCLCSRFTKTKDLPSLVLLHPESEVSSQDPECYKKIRQAVTNNPQTSFYVIAINCRQRLRIGSYPNLKYLTEHTTKQLLPEIVEKAR